MKKLALVLIFSVSYFISNAQLDINYGIKAGFNYNSIDDLNVTGGFAGFNQRIKSESDLGYHIGIYSQFNFTKFYVRTELFYMQNKNDYSDPLSSFSKLKLSTLELPVLAGLNIIKSLSFYTGPSFVYNLESDFSNFFELEFENKISLGINVGAAFEINKFRFDLRYTRGLSENQAFYFDDLPVDGLGYSVDIKPNQFLLSVSYQLN